MSYSLINLSEIPTQESPWFVEGAVLAANFTMKPLDPATWVGQLFGEEALGHKGEFEQQINAQYAALKTQSYSLLELLEQSDVKEECLSDFSEGFMNLWPTVEEQWQEKQPSDGTIRMLQAYLTTMMLAIDEQATHEQMQQAGIEDLPQLDDFYDQLDIMIAEIAMAADAEMVGDKAQSFNPYKEVGRNSQCPCGSGKKFKQCCGR
ncbi:SEC-C metal-binding domain-containing protein [Vibrio agarivorans]|uniref:SEC-C metal-binding domain-containing protein n=1 Tax=Vibrio agarivorans TaxID=153622 RepID=A0ABT7Y6G7_9VIBR|nr:SEC-C metal-binding domain-containing protein [Vibrio agarivorans]MDN2483636.1 SEC-C metal-binding domain-containing protein [Vibrio agarivorans]